jgi:hypothetical protein
MVENIIPNLKWYTGLSEIRKVQPRCPFASVETCPRYFQSLSLLGCAGSTSIDDAEEERLIDYWKSSDLWPKTREYETSIMGPEGNPRIFTNFCPEITFDRFGYFATFFAGYSDEIDSDSARARLTKQGAATDDWRWRWSSLTELHYSDCHYYSLLDHRSKNNRFPFINHEPLERKKSDATIEIPNESIIQKNGFKERWKKLSSKVKIILISITAVVALFATFLTNVEKILDFFETNESTNTVPNITVKLMNSSDVGVIVFARGDFMLWLPGPGANHTIGKYEFLMTDGKSPEGGSFVVKPKETVPVYAKILNTTHFARILSQSDCDLSLILYRAGTGLIHTNQIPFTENAILKYYLEADVGK